MAQEILRKAIHHLLIETMQDPTSGDRAAARIIIRLVLELQDTHTDTKGR